MGALDEMKGDFMQMIGLLGAIIGFVILFALFSISIWLVVLVLVAGIGIYFGYKWWRGGG